MCGASAGGRPKVKGTCFIATATMGTCDHPTVLLFRAFRDEVLDKRDWGRQFVHHYYKLSPAAAKVIERSRLMKKGSYWLIVRPCEAFIRTVWGRARNDPRNDFSPSLRGADIVSDVAISTFSTAPHAPVSTRGTEYRKGMNLTPRRLWLSPEPMSSEFHVPSPEPPSPAGSQSLLSLAAAPYARRTKDKTIWVLCRRTIPETWEHRKPRNTPETGPERGPTRTGAASARFAYLCH